MSANRAVLATLLYHSLFKYPLKKQEIKNFLISDTVDGLQLERSLKMLLQKKLIIKKNNLYALKGQESYISLRESKEAYSKYKKIKANLYAKILKSVPTVKLIAITGALAMDNSTKDDDIDLLIVTSANRLWTTRFFSNLLLLPFKRSPKSKKQKDKACLNIFLDERDLKIRGQNLYVAHEIAQMKPLYNKNDSYQRFISTNKWIHQYLPNWKQFQPEINIAKRDSSLTRPESHRRITHHSSLLEIFLKNLQLNYMRSKVTSEKITDTQLFFHPKSTQRQVLVSYQRKIKLLTGI